ncbi:MAG: hypothetical protein FWF71_00630 [Actinomycetia bacterium]|nr:hypothetical protein [Actinomycetes bacterium]
MRDHRIREAVVNEPQLVTEAELPVLVDEWQKWPDVFNHVRRAVDANACSGLLRGHTN